MTYRHYPKADTLVIWQQFEGIYGRSRGDQMFGEEKRQLKTVLAGRRTFFFSNWITEFNADALIEMEAELKTKIKKGEFEEDPELLKQQLRVVQLLRANVLIRNGAFYLNAQGRLSASQEVTVRNIGKILTEANQLIRISLRDSIARDETGLNAEDDHLLEQSLEQRLLYLTLEGQHLRVRWPISGKSYKGQMQDEDVQKAIGFLRDAGADVRHAQGQMTVELKGKPGQPTALAGTTGKHHYRPNVVPHVKVTPAYQPAKAREDFFRNTDRRYKK